MVELGLGKLWKGYETRRTQVEVVKVHPQGKVSVMLFLTRGVNGLEDARRTFEWRRKLTSCYMASNVEGWMGDNKRRLMEDTSDRNEKDAQDFLKCKFV